MKIFDEIICFVGKDYQYSIDAINIIVNKKINIKAIIGINSDKIYEAISNNNNLNNVIIINEKRPWLDHKFLNIVNKDNIKILGVNCGFDYIIPEEIINLLPIINLHPAYLPFNKGCHHSFWGIIDNTLLGATLHWMSAGIDDGPIIKQKSFQDNGIYTADEIQKKSNLLCLELLNENILSIINRKLDCYPQEGGSYHSKSEIINKTTLNCTDSIEINYLFNLLRATCNKGNGIIIEKNKLKYKIIIEKIVSINE
jgi:methionyl-tRNA formyltransferase